MKALTLLRLAVSFPISSTSTDSVTPLRYEALFLPSTASPGLPRNSSNRPALIVVELAPGLSPRSYPVWPAPLEGELSLAGYLRALRPVSSVSVTPSDVPRVTGPQADPTALHDCPSEEAVPPAHLVVSGSESALRPILLVLRSVHSKIPFADPALRCLARHARPTTPQTPWRCSSRAIRAAPLPGAVLAVLCHSPSERALRVGTPALASDRQLRVLCEVSKQNL